MQYTTVAKGKQGEALCHSKKHLFFSKIFVLSPEISKIIFPPFSLYIIGAIDLSIPATIDGYPVVGIGEAAFEGNRDILSLTLPAGLREIGRRAFYECTALKHIDFPEALRTMGFAAFYGCASLTEAVLPKTHSGVLQNSVFQDCTSLKRVNIPAGVTAINGWAFCGCTSIGQQVFWNCPKLTTINLPDNLSLIGYETAYPSNLHFNDENEIAAWAEAPVHWAAAAGLLIGKGNGNIAGKAAASRGEVAIAFAAFAE